MGSRVDKSSKFPSEQASFFRVTLSVDDPLQSPKFVWKLRKFSRDVEKKLERVFLCDGRKHVLIFGFNERSEVFCVFSSPLSLFGDRVEFFFLRKNFQRTSKIISSRSQGYLPLNFSDSLCEWRSWSNWAGLDSACFGAKTNEKFPESFGTGLGRNQESCSWWSAEIDWIFFFEKFCPEVWKKWNSLHPSVGIEALI